MSKLLKKNDLSEIKFHLGILIRRLKYDRDVLGEFDLRELEKAIEEARGLIKEKASAEKQASFTKRYSKWLQLPAAHAWIENVEVVLVALVIALGIRAYFLQPFKIPTHSMFPTLYGVYEEKRENNLPKPFIIKQIGDIFLQGKVYHRLHTVEGGQIESISEERLLPILPLKVTKVTIGSETYSVWTSLENIQKAGYFFSVGDVVPPNSDLLNYSVQSGDHLFVDRMAYHFRKPRNGETTVFITAHIPKIQLDLQRQGILGSQYYIKRCVGIPGDSLRIEPPYLYVNGEKLEGKALERVYSMKDQYNGYVNAGDFLPTPSDTYQIPEKRYWMMGDNSLHSFDSRIWGSVPEGDLIGSALFVYWPFTKRWGKIQ